MLTRRRRQGFRQSNNFQRTENRRKWCVRGSRSRVAGCGMCGKAGNGEIMARASYLDCGNRTTNIAGSWRRNACLALVCGSCGQAEVEQEGHVSRVASGLRQSPRKSHRNAHSIMYVRRSGFSSSSKNRIKKHDLRASRRNWTAAIASEITWSVFTASACCAHGLRMYFALDFRVHRTI